MPSGKESHHLVNKGFVRETSGFEGDREYVDFRLLVVPQLFMLLGNHITTHFSDVFGGRHDVEVLLKWKKLQELV